MAKDKRAILWDVGGTLVDFACSLPESVRGRLAACGIDHSIVSDQHIEQTFADFDKEEPQWQTIAQERAAECRWLQALLHDAALDGDVIQQAARRMPRYFDLYRPVEGVIGLLSDLRRQQIPMAIVSNWAPSLPEFLEHHQLTEFFSAIVYSAQDGILKPDPRIFERALSALNVRPENAIFIGDTVTADIVPTKAMGMRAIHFEPRKISDSRDADNVAGLRRLFREIL